MKTLIILTLSFLSLSTFACLDGKGFFPEHDLRIPTTVKGNMTKLEFEETIQKVVDIYQPIFKEKRMILRSFANWNSDSVNARATRSGRTRRIIMYGGLGRHPMLYEDELLLVTCHEIGHHLGGAPRAGIWASGEGQADYFTSLKCLRRVFREHPKEIDHSKVPEAIKKECNTVFADTLEAQICMRTKLASIQLMTVFSMINERDVAPSVDARDANVVTRTNHRHPLVQCRYDTLAAGAICPVDFNEDVSNKDETVGTCHQKNGHIKGLRPRCWFAPRGV
jgi:hypothetical protein